MICWKGFIGKGISSGYGQGCVGKGCVGRSVYGQGCVGKGMSAMGGGGWGGGLPAAREAGRGGERASLNCPTFSFSIHVIEFPTSVKTLYNFGI